MKKGMEMAAGRLEQPERNLLTEMIATVEAMAQVEGPKWMREQEEMEKRTTAPADWNRGLQNALERLQKGEPATVHSKTGTNRWDIESDGSVSFSETLASSDEHLEKARELGFVIVP